jgi:hypothetical protein
MDNRVSSHRGAFSPQSQKILLWILLIASAAEFVARGPARYLLSSDWTDLSQNYAATRLWLRGQNFAQPENFVALWKNEVGITLGATTVRTHLAPPPGTLVLMAPIGALPWPVAKLAWLALLVSAFGVTVWSLIKTAGFRWDEPCTLAFVAGCLALAPFHTGIASANQTILIVGFCALGIWAASGRRDVVAGLLFGVACSLKPQIGSFLVLYYLVRRRWRLFFTALGFTIVLAMVAILWMQMHGVSWTQDYFHNVKVIAAQNKIDDFTSANPIRFLLINLQVPIYSFTRSAWTSNVVALSTGLLLTGVWAFLVLRKRTNGSDLLALGTIAVICLMPVYHRLYDASLLAIPFCWCLSRLSGRLRNISKIALLLMIPFLIPGPALLQQLAEQGRIPDAWSSSWCWDDFVMPHEPWFLLLICLVLLYGLALQNSDPTESAQ